MGVPGHWCRLGSQEATLLPKGILKERPEWGLLFGINTRYTENYLVGGVALC